jgi:4-amino-4-deoxy-L-arabinose transferase-like glycosyltransferase
MPNENPQSEIKNIPGGEKTLLIGLFLLAFLLRLGYIWQISSAPYFDDPIGDSQVYYQRALEILNGDFLGKEIFFHSSPPYPYFIALALALSGKSVFFVYLLQILIGSGNCILIYRLAKKLADGKIYPAFLAGLFAVFYGLFAFFDGDMLMIFLTLFSVDLSLLFLLKFQESKKAKYSFLAGLFFGLAVLDKPNLLIFVPAGIFFLISEFSFRPKQWNWKPALLYLIATGLMIIPFTLRNYVVGKDFVPISSNGGVNFYIGNNSNSVGTFKLPKNSGLQDPGLYDSSMRVAEQELGRKLKPSEVSNFWTGKALNFIIHHPIQELKLLSRKFLLLFNYYEVPNHQNYYYIRTEFGSLLNLMPVGFWLIVPFALTGIAWQIKIGLNPAGKLYLSFLICYTISLVLFFVTERYRLPMIPIYIVFAAAAIDELRRTYRSSFIFWGVSLAIAVGVVYLPYEQFSYSFDRIAVGTKYFNKAIRIQGNKGYEYMQQAIINYKWALETEPTLAYGHFDLGLAYEALGFNSDAVKEYQKTLELEPGYESAKPVLQLVKEKYEKESDRMETSSLPRTPFEEIQAGESTTKPEVNIKLYQELIVQDPYHYEAMNRLGQIYFQQGQYRNAMRIYKKGLALRPNHFMLLKNLAETYEQLGKTVQAKQLWQKCLQLDPNNQLIKKKLQ